MLNGHESSRLQLTDDEALALLSLCMMSEEQLDAVSENAIKKLANYCRRETTGNSNHKTPAKSELSEAG